MNKKNSLDSKDIIDDISRKLKKPLYIYKNSITLDELNDNTKKYTFYLARIIIFLEFFFIITLTYILSLWLITKKFQLLSISRNVIFIIFIFSILLSILKIKKNSQKKANESNIKIYFYNEYLIIKTKNSLEGFFYNELIIKLENKDRFILSFKGKNFIIEKNKIDNDLLVFIKKLNVEKNKYKIAKNENDIFNYLNHTFDNYIINITNEKNDKILKEYFNTTKARINLFIKYLIKSFIALNIIMLILNKFSIVKINFNFSYFFFCFIVDFISTIIYTNYYAKYEAKKILEKEIEEFYFYEDFIFIHLKNVFFKCNYDDIKFISENKNFLFITLKSIYSPIIINKSKFNSKDYSFLNKKIHTIKK